MSILQELWYGNIRPNEDKVITDEEKKLVSLIARHHETLSSSLKNDELNVFEKYVDCFTEYASLIEAQAFEIGFKLALKLLKEQPELVYTPAITIVINDLTRLLANMLSLSAEKKMKSLNSQSIDQKQMQMILDKKQARGQRDGVSKNDKKEVDESKSQNASQNLEALFELGAMMIRKAVSHNNDYDTDYESNYEEEQGFDLTM